MHIPKTKSTKRYLVIAIAAVIVLGGYGIAAWKNSFWPFMNTVDLGPVSPEEKKAGEKIKSDSVKESTKDSVGSSGSDQPLPPTPNPATSTSTILVDITAATQNGSTFQIRTLIQAVLGGGECKLTLTKGSRVYTATATIQPSSTSSTCMGFDVPVSELDPGNWSVVIDVSSSAVAGSATKEINIK